MQKDSTQSIGYIELLRQNADFRNLWLGQVASLAGDWFNLIASAALVANLTSSGFAVGGLFVVRMLAQFFMGPIGGLLADRFNRKSILIVTDIARAIVVLGFLVVKEPEQVWLLYGLTAVQLGLSGIFTPTKDAILPDVVRKEDIGAANALNATTWSTMLAVGAALGGLVAGEWGLTPAFLIDSISFILSGVLIWRVGYTHKPDPLQPAISVGQIHVEYFAGLKFLGQNREIFVIAVQKASMALAVSSVFQILQVEMASKIFVIGEGGSTSLGLFYAMVGLGTGFSPILTRIFTGDQEGRIRLAIAVGYIIAAAGLLVVATLSSFGVVLFGTFLRGFGVAIVWVFSTTLLLQKLPGAIRGRVFGAEFALFTLMNAIGAPIGGWVLDTVDNGVPLLLMGMTFLLLVLGLFWVIKGVVGVKPDGPVLHPAGSQD